MRRTDILAAFAGTILSPVLLAGASAYSVQNLGDLGSGASFPSAINNSGFAVGFVTNSAGNQVPVSFNGEAVPLGGTGQANAVNDTGTAVGSSFSNGVSYVTEWSNGRMTNLEIKGYGTSINDTGEIAGGYETANGQLRAFIFENGNLKDLGTLAGGNWSSAYALNHRGQVAGTSSIAGGAFRAFLWTGNDLINLGTLGGANSHALAINNAGEVVGNAQTARGLTNAFLWRGGALTNLGTLGGMQSYAYGINDAGTIVGYSWIAGNRSTAGFVYSDGVLADLNTLIPPDSGWTITAAYAVNNKGEILGVGILKGKAYAVELLPQESHESTAVPAESLVP